MKANFDANINLQDISINTSNKIVVNSTKALPVSVTKSKDSCELNINSSNKNNTKSVRTEAELAQRFKSTFDKYGLRYKIETIMNIVNTNNKDILLNASENEISNLNKALDAAFAKNLNPQTGEVDIEKAKMTAKNYNVAFKTGFETIEEYEEKNKNYDKSKTLADLLRESNGLEQDFDFNNASQDEIAGYLQKYLDDVKQKYLKNVNSNDENAIKEAEKEALKEFGLLITNIPDEDKNLLAGLNDYTKMEALLASFDNINNSMSFADSVDVLGENYIENGLGSLISSYKSVEGLNKTREKIEKLPEEKQALATAIYTIGVANSNTINEEEQTQLLTEINEYASQNPWYRNYLENIANFVENNPDKVPVGREKFETLIGETTDNNYRTVVNDLANNTKTELKISQKPKTEAQSEKFTENLVSDNNKNQVSIGHKQQILAENVQEANVKINAIKEKLSSNDTDTENDNPSANIPLGIISYKDVTTENLKDVIKLVFTGKANCDNSTESTLIQNYKRMDQTQQGKLLKIATGKWFNNLLDETKGYAAKFFLASGQKASSFYLTQKIEKLAEGNDDDNKLVS